MGIVFWIVPDCGERRRARGCGGPAKRPLLLAGGDERNEVLDLGDAFGRQGLDDLHERVASRWWAPSARNGGGYTRLTDLPGRRHASCAITYPMHRYQPNLRQRAIRNVGKAIHPSYVEGQIQAGAA